MITSLNRTDTNEDINSDTRTSTSPTLEFCNPHRDVDDSRPLEQRGNPIAREEHANITLFLLDHAVEIGVHETNVTSDARGLLRAYRQVHGEIS